MTTTKVILGILGAAAAGVVIGMLIAPEKGEDLRKNIKKTADDWADEVSQWMGKGKKYLSEVKDRALEETEQVLEEAEESVNGVKGSVSRKRAGL